MIDLIVKLFCCLYQIITAHLFTSFSYNTCAYLMV